MELAVNILNAFKSKGEEYCINFAKKVMKATDEEIEEAIERVFNQNNLMENN